MIRRLLIVVPLALVLTAVSLFMPAQRVSIDGIGKLSFDTSFNFSVGPGTAYASPDIEVDAVSSGTGTGSTITVSHTTGSGSNLLMLVGVSWHHTSERSVSSVKYGGTALTSVGTAGDGYCGMSIYKLVAPASDTANVVVTLSGTTSGGTVGVMTFTGVDQSTPLGTFAGDMDKSPTTATVNVSSATGELVFDTVSSWGSMTVGAGQTERWNSGTTGGVGSTEPGAASVTMSWTVGENDWAIGAVPIKPASAPEAGWLTGWCYRVKITIDSDDISDNLTHFPVLIYLSNACGIGNAYDMTPVFDEVGANSKKIAVTEDDGTTQLYVEIEKWDETAEEAWLWVSKSGWTISSTTDTDIYLYYCSTQPDNTTYVGDSGSRTEVWDSDFKGVWHLTEETGGTDAFKDSTSNANHGTDSGDPTFGATGEINGAIDFDGGDDYITTIPAGTSFGQKATISVWAKFDTVVPDGERDGIVGSKYYTDGEFSFHYHGWTSSQAILLTMGSGKFVYWDSPPPDPPSDFHHLAVIVDTTQAANADIVKLYVDNSLQTQDSFSGITTEELECTNYPVYIGYNRQTHHDGILDEVRISNVSRSAAWIKATYETQRDDLLTFGSEEEEEEAGWLIGWCYRVKITIDSDDFDEDATHFPVLIHLSDACGIGNAYDLTPVFDEVGANSKKIAVTEADGTTQLYVEIEKWDETAEEAWLWVSKSGWTISSTTDTDIYLYYCNTQPDNTTYVGDSGSRPEVWNSNFKGVWHLCETSGGIAVDAVNSNTGTGSSITVPHTTGTGANRLMLVGISAFGAGLTISSIKYGGTDLIFVGSESYEDYYGGVFIYKFVNPPAGTANVVVTFSQNVEDGGIVGVMTFTGVDQTTPLGTFAGAQGETNTASVDVSSATDELVFDTVIAAYTDISVGGGQTERWNLASANCDGGGSTEPGATTVEMSWTLTNPNYWVIGAVPIKPAVTSGAVKDSTSNTNHGTTSGDPTFGETGEIDGAIEFDGDDDYLDMSSMNPQSYDDFTVSAWYKASHSAVVDDEYIFSHLVDSADGPGIVLSLTDDDGYADYLRVSIYDNSSNYTPYYGTSDVVDQQFHYVVGTRGGGRIKIYVDGTNETDAADVDNGETINVNAPSGPHIGDLPGDTEQVYGILDEVRISGTARSAAWIDASYESERDDLLAFGSEETPPSVNISNSPTSYDFGYVTDDETYATGLAYFTVTNNSGAAVDITIQGTDMETAGGGGAEIKVEHIEFDIGADGSTKSVTDVGSLSSAFFRNSTARRTSGGPTGSTSNTNWNVFCAAAQLTGTDELTGYRAGTQSATVRMRGEVWSYVGDGGGNNEFIVRWRGYVTIASGSKTGSQAVSGISNRNDCIPFVQGLVADLASTSDGNRVVSHAHIDSSNNLIVERGETGTEVEVYVAVVEFTGSNWNVGHALLTSPSTGSNDVTLKQNSDGTGGDFDTTDWDTAFIQASMSADTDGDHALEDTWFVVEPHPSSTTQARVTFDSTAGLTGAEVFIHVLQHDSMNVSRYTDSQDIPTSDDHAVSGLTNLDESALEWYVFTNGTGTAYARGATTAYLTSTTNVAEWTHRTGNAGTYRFGVINLSSIVEAAYSWDLSDTAVPGEDIIGFKAGLQNGSYNIIVRKNSPYNNLVTGLADSASQSWGLELHTPTNITEYGEQLEGTITLTATLS